MRPPTIARMPTSPAERARLLGGVSGPTRPRCASPVVERDGRRQRARERRARPVSAGAAVCRAGDRSGRQHRSGALCARGLARSGARWFGCTGMCGVSPRGRRANGCTPSPATQDHLYARGRFSDASMSGERCEATRSEGPRLAAARRTPDDTRATPTARPGDVPSETLNVDARKMCPATSLGSSRPPSTPSTCTST